ncbi:MAG: Fe-S-cluster-containing hydrogenase [Planctomycetia bacterium]|nr:Fe-S-cluster-containing hydrogenase [Planctomycetia bacterium]
MKPDSTDIPAVDPALSDLENVPGFPGSRADEFPEGASEFTDEVSRRRFLALMGASAALATGVGCNLRPASQRKIVPYTTQPDEITPGVPLFFATAANLGGYGSGVLVRSHEGRPVKVEGNIDHPSSLGGASIHSLASILDIYDPDRSATCTRRGEPVTYESAIAELRKQLYNTPEDPKKNLRLRIVTETVTSPTLSSQIQKLLNLFPNARWVQFDLAGRDNVLEGTRLASGNRHNISYDFTKADVVLSIDSDFLCIGPGHVRYARDFASRRKVRQNSKDGGPADEMNRLYVVECMPTNTGAIADHRLPMLTGLMELFVRELAVTLGIQVTSWANQPQLGSANEWIKPLADDLKAKAGKSIVVAGDHLPPVIHAIVFAINDKLGNFGQTVHLSAPIEARPEGKVTDLKTLTTEMASKSVDALIILGGANPAYSAPADVPFAENIKNVPFTFHLGQHQDETGVLCEWHVPEAHFLEAWGDIRAHDGTATIQQPLIAPLHGGKSAIEVLAAVMSEPVREGLEIVRAFWQNTDEVKKLFPSFEKPATFEIFWQESVRKGVVTRTTPAVKDAKDDKDEKKKDEKKDEKKNEKSLLAPNWTTDLKATLRGELAANEYEVNFRLDPALYDGRFANNGWLQELPKPLTKISWDNAAFVSPKTAREKFAAKTDYSWTAGEHGRAAVNVLELRVNIGGTDRIIKAPIWILPGHADGAVTIHLGGGRTRAGRVAHTPDEPNAEGKPYRGFNAYAIRSSDEPWFTRNVKAVKIGGAALGSGQQYFLACTQGYWQMAEKDPLTGKLLDRAPVRRATLAEFQKVPEFAKIPPAAVGETDLINENVPHPVKHGEPVPSAHKKDDHKHDHGHNGNGHGHDKRLHPLNMYNPAEGLVPDLPDGQRRRWAMAIDLTACTGCSACVIACQGENNIPVVGKTQVTKAREMYWISIDRYYDFQNGLPPEEQEAEAIKTYFQPRMCVQCENAPCEVVCPVGATVHSADGLNDMTYNRCVGTRYCSNNCPYKVRRFNFLTYQDWHTETYKLGRNPDVSVRSRGVMEKCTFCVQRIRGAEIVAEREFRPIRDGEILTACQSACPSNAIIFGDINDPDAGVSRWKNEPTNYGLLAELNTRPRLTHMAVLKNPNPAMPKPK